LLVQTAKRTTNGEIVSLTYVDLLTQRVDTLVEVPIPVETVNRAASHYFETVVSSNRVSWILHTNCWNRRGFPERQVRWMTPDGMQSRELNGTPAAPPSQVALEVDGRTFVIFATNPPNETIDLDPQVMPSLQPIEPTIQPEPNTTPAPVRWSQLRPADGSVVLVADTFPERRFTLAGVNSPSYFWMMSDTPNGPFVAVAVATEVKSRYKHILTGKPERLEGEIRIFRLPDPAAE
jgi:hypothetical protein